MRVAEYKLPQSRNPLNDKLNRARGNNAARRLAVEAVPPCQRFR
jgi:hypothetical protein